MPLQSRNKETAQEILARRREKNRTAQRKHREWFLGEVLPPPYSAVLSSAPS